MHSSTASDALKDPVCGKLISTASPHRHLHGGAVFCFCSARCRELFIATPARFIVFSLAPQVPGSGVLADADQDLSGLTYADLTRVADPSLMRPAALDPDDFTETSLHVGGLPTTPAARTPGAGGQVPAIRQPAPPPGAVRATGWRGFLARLLPRRERGFARRVSRELLALHRAVSSKYTRLRGRALYREIVMARSQVGPDVAEALLQRAEENYATWPTPRPLTFRDVVHWLAVSEFLASHGEAPWIQDNVSREVDLLVPHNL